MIPARLERIPSLFSEGIEERTLTFAERRRRRQALLRRDLRARLRRLSCAVTYVSSPKRLAAIVSAVDLLARDQAVAPLEAPDPRHALGRPDGLCGFARSLNPAGALEAYSAGLTLFAPLGPATWWSPSRRWSQAPGTLRHLVDETLSKLADLGASASADCAFEETVAACARPQRSQQRLGFGPALMRAYFELHDSGLAHSIEIRGADGQLAAGAFGLTIGRVFMTEACFGPPELARAALILLDRQLASQNFVLHEARLGCAPGSAPRDDVGDLGFEALAREDFLSILRLNLCGGGIARWRLATAVERRADERAPFGQKFDNNLDGDFAEPRFASAA